MGFCAKCGNSVEGNYTVTPIMKLDSFATRVKMSDGAEQIVPNVCNECKDREKNGRKIYKFSTVKM